jgi:predicted transcriptional regulator of viral defense system
MKYALLVKKLHYSKERFISREKLNEYCDLLALSYSKAVSYLIKYSYIERIVKGFFYVPSIEERKLGTDGINLYEAIAKAMEYKKINNWYFALETAIKFNNASHEFFSITFVASDKIFRSKSIFIFGNKVKFVKLKSNLFNFGIKKEEFPYSDLEKTLLDLIHLRVYNGKNKERILDEISGWKGDINKNKIKKYSKNYSETVRKILEEFI